MKGKKTTYIGRVVEEGQTGLVTLALEATAVLGVVAAVLWRNQSVWRGGVGLVGAGRA